MTETKMPSVVGAEGTALGDSTAHSARPWRAQLRATGAKEQR